MGQLLEQTILKIENVNRDLSIQAAERLDNLIMPRRALGKVMSLAEDMAAIYKNVNPKIEKCGTIIFAADHGVADEQISLYPQEVTIQLVKAYINQNAGVNAMSMAVDAPVHVVDLGVKDDISYLTKAKLEDAPLKDAFFDRKIRWGTDSFLKGPAMTREEAIKSLEIGIEMADIMCEKYDAIAAGEMGIGNTTTSAAIISVMTGISPEDATGRGTGLNDNDIPRKVAATAKGIEVNQPNPNDALDVLTKVGGFEIGAMAGFYLGCAANNQPILLDGFISSAAALITHGLAPQTKDYMIGSHLSKEKAHIEALKTLEKEPLFNYNFRLGEATGAVFLFPLLKGAANLLNKMATFEEAEVARNNLDDFFKN